MATFGNTTIQTVVPNVATGYKLAYKFQMNAENGNLSSLNFYCGGAGGGDALLRCAIYGDTGGDPAALLGQTDEVTIASAQANGWVSLNFATVVALIASTWYWLAYCHGNNRINIAEEASGGTRRYKTATYASEFTNPFGAVSSDSKLASIYGIYTPSTKPRRICGRLIEV